jgi:hypothetical protein
MPSTARIALLVALPLFLFSFAAPKASAAGQAQLKLQVTVDGGGALTPHDVITKSLIYGSTVAVGFPSTVEFSDTGDSAVFHTVGATVHGFSYWNPYEANYSASQWVCTSNLRSPFSLSNGSQTVPFLDGEQVVCTITFTATFVSDTIITLRKEVINDDGGVSSPGDWQILLVGSDPYFEDLRSGPELSRMVAPGRYAFYIAGEGDDSVPLGYANSASICEGGRYSLDGEQPEQNWIDIATGEHIVCKNQADDIPGYLTLSAVVVGGPASAHNFTLTATTSLRAGRDFSDFGDSTTQHLVWTYTPYTASWSGPSGYNASKWTCTNGAFLSGTGAIFTEGGFHGVCTITLTYTGPEKLDPVIIIPGILGSWQKDFIWVIDPIFHTYDNLINTLLANGYVKDQTLFTLPYNWEASNFLNAQVLQEKIAEIKTVCSCSKVDIVAHSMGGFIVRSYVEGNHYQNDIDQVIFLATPHLGATYDYKAWEAGNIESENPSLEDRFFDLMKERIFINEARIDGFNDIFDFVRNKPISSVQELLPIFDYLYPQPQNFLLHYPNLYPRNPFLENLDSPENINLLKTRGVRIYNVTANNGNSTPTGYSIVPSNELPKWENGKPITTQFGPGDGTVPKQSAELLGVDQQFNNTTHNLIASSSASYVFKTLTGKEPTTIVGKKYSVFSDADWSLLYIKLLSPIDMQIIAPDGKRLGKDFETGGELNEIPNAFYSGFKTDNEYAVITNPLPGEYKIKTIGTGTGGHYSIVSDYIDTQGDINAESSGTTSPQQIIETSFTLSPNDRTLKPLYRWDGFLQPINDTAHKITTNTSVFKGGSTIPVKLQLKKPDGTIAQAAVAPQWLQPQMGGTMSAAVDETIYTDPATTGSFFKWDPTNKQYIYNWSTKGVKAGYWYKISVRLDDGTTQWAYVGLR